MKLITLNIQGDKHLDKIAKFLKAENPDVVCLQEVFKADTKYFKDTLNMHSHYAPMMDVKVKNRYDVAPRGIFGLQILTKRPPLRSYLSYYVGSEDRIPNFVDGQPDSNNRVLLGIDYPKDERQFTVFTTHFTWSPNATCSPLQRTHFKKMLKLLADQDEFMLCGDFNSPRGGEIYSILARKFRDHIPSEIISTIDPDLHSVKGLQLVVDAVFSTPGYQVDNVRAVGGLSDHKAIVCIVR